jgi:aminopeptidase N
MSFYAVTVRAPAGLPVVAAGHHVETSEDAGQQSQVFLAGPARDFYMAASYGFALVTAEWDGVRLNSYAPANQRDAAGAVLAYAAAALETFSARYGPYPYAELDFVAIPTLALGIEYPGMIALNRDLYDPAADFGGTPVEVLLESTTAHEVGHQWFYNLVGNDQLDEPWLDEALTQYATWRYYADVQGPGGEAGYGAALDARWGRVDHALIPIGLPVSAYQENEYGAIVYGRGPLFFDALGQQIGEATLETLLRSYADQYRWRIATGAEFQALAETTCQCDLDGLFEAWVWE